MPQTEKINVRGVMFDNVTMEEAFEKATSLISADGFSYMVTPNSEIVEACVENPTLYEIINGADLIIPDGVGVVYASKILKTPLKEKVAGIEMAARILEYAAKEHLKLYFFGGAKKTDTTPAVWEMAANAIKEKYPDICIEGRDGFFAEEETEDVLAGIRDSGADILFVCLGAPKQERFIYKNRENFGSVRFAAGLGGSLDVFAGVAERAPEFYLKHNLEWLYRFSKNPSRVGRMMKLPKFLLGTVFHGNRPTK